MTDFSKSDPPQEFPPRESGVMTYPPDAVVIPFVLAAIGHETGLAVFAHRLALSGRDPLVLSRSRRKDQGLSLIVLLSPLIAWNLDTGRTSLCRALIVVEQNTRGLKDVWTCDEVRLARKMFETCNLKGK